MQDASNDLASVVVCGAEAVYNVCVSGKLRTTCRSFDASSKKGTRKKATSKRTADTVEGTALPPPPSGARTVETRTVDTNSAPSRLPDAEDGGKPFELVEGLRDCRLLLRMSPKQRDGVLQKVFSGDVSGAVVELDRFDAAEDSESVLGGEDLVVRADKVSKTKEFLLSTVLADRTRMQGRAGTLVVKVLNLATEHADKLARLVNKQPCVGSVLLGGAHTGLWRKLYRESGFLGSRRVAVPVLATKVLAAVPSTNIPLRAESGRSVRVCDWWPRVDDDVLVTVLRSSLPFSVGKAAAKSVAHTIDTLRGEVWRDSASFMLLCIGHSGPKLDLVRVFDCFDCDVDGKREWARRARTVLSSRLTKLGFVEEGDTFCAPSPLAEPPVHLQRRRRYDVLVRRSASRLSS